MACKICDPVEGGKAEEMRGGLGSEDGGAFEKESVEEEVSEDPAKYVLVEREKRSRLGCHAWVRRKEEGWRRSTSTGNSRSSVDLLVVLPHLPSFDLGFQI
jgi:hypothetical protein